MKKLLFLLLFSGMITGVAMAQEQKEMKTDQKEWDQKVKTELKLTDEQVVKYEAICKEYGEKIDAIKKDASLTKEVQKEKKMISPDDILLQYISQSELIQWKNSAPGIFSITVYGEKPCCEPGSGCC